MAPMDRKKSVLIVVFCVDIGLFFDSALIYSFYHKIGPPVLINAVLFYFMYHNKRAAYICFYILAALELVRGGIVIFFTIAALVRHLTPDMTFAPYAYYACLADTAAYILTLIVIRWAKSPPKKGKQCENVRKN